jgi:hypothetical protein
MGINKGAADFALEWVKQVITLASGIVALSATFLEKITTNINWTLILLIMSWGCFIASVMTGLETISTIAKSHLDDNNDWSIDSGYRYAKACKILFIVGFCLFCLFASLSFIFK